MKLSQFMTGYVYLLENNSGDRYVGSTNDLDRRMIEHKNGHKNSRYTNTKKSMKLAYFEEFNDLSDARKYERLIKKNRKYRKEFYDKANSRLPV